MPENPESAALTYNQVKWILTRARALLNYDGPWSLYTGCFTFAHETELPIIQRLASQMAVTIQIQKENPSANKLLKYWFKRKQPQPFTYSRLKNIFRWVNSLIYDHKLVNKDYEVGVLVEHIPVVKKVCTKKGIYVHSRVVQDLGGESPSWSSLHFTSPSIDFTQNIGKSNQSIVKSVYDTGGRRYLEAHEPGRTERICRRDVARSLDELREFKTLWPGIRNLENAVRSAGMLAGLEDEPENLPDIKIKSYLASSIKTLADLIESPYPLWTLDPSLILDEPWVALAESFCNIEKFKVWAFQNSPKHFRAHNIFIDNYFGVSGVTIELIRRKKKETLLYKSKNKTIK